MRRMNEEITGSDKVSDREVRQALPAKRKLRLKIPGVIKGLSVTFRTMMQPTVTVQYPHEKEEVAPRARGVIALKEENCTACMLCVRSCPDWCIYIEGHKTKAPPRREGGKERSVNILDRFDIDKNAVIDVVSSHPIALGAADGTFTRYASGIEIQP